MTGLNPNTGPGLRRCVQVWSWLEHRLAAITGGQPQLWAGIQQVAITTSQNPPCTAAPAWPAVATIRPHRPNHDAAV